MDLEITKNQTLLVAGLKISEIEIQLPSDHPVAISLILPDGSKAVIQYRVDPPALAFGWPNIWKATSAESGQLIRPVPIPLAETAFSVEGSEIKVEYPVTALDVDIDPPVWDDDDPEEH